jgi:hypothetical protein
MVDDAVPCGEDPEQRRDLQLVRLPESAPPSPASGSHPVAVCTVSAAEVDGACSEVEVALTQAGLCIEFLLAVSDGDAVKAALDARAAIRLAQEVIRLLGERCDREVKRAISLSPGPGRRTV